MSILSTLEKANNKSVISKIKTVKNAAIYESNNIVFCRHYDTVIFALDTNTGKAEILKNLSQTSNRQIRYLLDFFNPIEVVDLNENEKSFAKWSFSGKMV